MFVCKIHPTNIDITISYQCTVPTITVEFDNWTPDQQYSINSVTEIGTHKPTDASSLQYWRQIAQEQALMEFKREYDLQYSITSQIQKQLGDAFRNLNLANEFGKFFKSISRAGGSLANSVSRSSQDKPFATLLKLALIPAVSISTPFVLYQLPKYSTELIRATAGALWSAYLTPKPVFFIPMRKEAKKLRLSNFEGSKNMISSMQNIINSIKYARRKKINMVLNYALFTGPAGVGKTEVAQIIANETGLQFFNWDVSKYGDNANGVNELEQGIKFLERCARFGRPCLILMDEIDGMVSSRENSDKASALLSKLLSLIGSNEIKGFKYYIIATTNKLSAVDPAILSRFIVKQFEELAPASIQKFAMKELNKYAQNGSLSLTPESIKATESLIQNLANNSASTKLSIDTSNVIFTGRDTAAFSKFLALGMEGENPEAYIKTNPATYRYLVRKREQLVQWFKESLALKQMVVGKDFGKIAKKNPSHHEHIPQVINLEPMIK